MNSCVLVRHGETDMAGRFCGHSDPPLNYAGERQIELAASMLRDAPQAIYTSDLKRARQSAEIIAAHFGVPMHLRPGLREIDFGEWEGLSWAEIEQRFGADARSWVEQYPHGVIPLAETYQAFQLRVQCEVKFLFAEAELHHVIAVTHGGFIKTALTEICGLSHSAAHERSAHYACVVPITSSVVQPR